MKITEGCLRLAASDVANFLACRRLTQLDLLMARKELRPRLDRVSPDVLERARRQARLQVASDDGRVRYEILDPQRDGDGGLVANRGLLALPEPAAGDLFFDIEGARYYCEDGREKWNGQCEPPRPIVVTRSKRKPCLAGSIASIQALSKAHMTGVSSVAELAASTSW